MKWFDHLRILHALKYHPIPHDVWGALMREAEIFSGLSAVEKAHLRELTTLFLYRKTLNGVQGLDLATEMRVTIAAQACLLVLKLGLNYFDGWIEVVIYPEAFRVVRDKTDATGLVSQEAHTLSGESWSRGPVILSWDDVITARPGHNVVVHEFAHKLDMLNGSANGMPPLHGNMDRKQWTDIFSHAYEHLQQQLVHHKHLGINSYGVTAPAEFFAVLTEYFFTAPNILLDGLPDVYDQLVLYYRQNPVKR